MNRNSKALTLGAVSAVAIASAGFLALHPAFVGDKALARAVEAEVNAAIEGEEWRRADFLERHGYDLVDEVFEGNNYRRVLCASVGKSLDAAGISLASLVDRLAAAGVFSSGSGLSWEIEGRPDSRIYIVPFDPSRPDEYSYSCHEIRLNTPILRLITWENGNSPDADRRLLHGSGHSWQLRIGKSWRIIRQRGWES